MEKVALSVPQVHCAGCDRIIHEKLDDAPGVQGVEVDIANRQVTVEYDQTQTTRETVRNHIKEAGFDAFISEEKPMTEREPPAAKPEAMETAAPPSRALWYGLLALGVAVLAIAGYVGYELYPRFNLPAVQGAGLFLLAAGAGIASFFSPCGFPLLVTLLARETGEQAAADGKGNAVGRGLKFATALSFGAAVFLLLTGLFIAFGGGAIFAGVTFTSTAGMTIRAVIGGILILLGLIQLGVLPNPLHAVVAISKPLMRSQARYRRQSPVLGFTLFGFAYLLAGFG